MQSYHVTINSINFVLVDTPGFNDTHRTDGDILKAIAEWLNNDYRQGTKLTGILYLHPIKDPRMEGSSLTNFRAFQRLCGENTFEHIFLCTTFWDCVSKSLGIQREKELCENPEFWAKMKDKGSKVVRIENYAQSKDVLLQMAQKSKVTLDIQKEMVEERLSLDNTKVGRIINAQMAQMAQMELEHKAEMAIELKKRDEENRRRTEELNSIMNAQQRLWEDQQAEQARLKAQMQEERRQADIRLAAEKKRHEELQAEIAAQKQRQMNERASREANEKKALAESHKRAMCKTFRAEFAGQTHALDRARNFRTVFAKLYGFHQQSPAFLRWCDRCFQLVGFRSYYHCEPCSLFICTACWTHGQRCKAESLHTPSYKKDTTPKSCCRRLRDRTEAIMCDRCRQQCLGLHFHCCDCLNDDYDICLRCVTTGGTCWNPGHWLHPTVTWPG